MFLVSGRVQGVGYRYFAQRHAVALGLTGYAKNLAGGRVEILAIGPAPALDELSGRLRAGPPWSDVRAVDETESTPLDLETFSIR